MTEWSDMGLVLDQRPFGDHDAILIVLTEFHGLQNALVKGAKGRRLRGVLQNGNTLHVTWRARLETQLGSFAIEPVQDRVSLILGHPNRLKALSSVCATLATTLPEKLHFAGLQTLTKTYLDVLADPTLPWLDAHLRWELATLTVLGYGLDLSACAVTGSTSDLRYVSPKSGRAVSGPGAVGYEDRLLTLPPFLIAADGGAPSIEDLAAGWHLVDFFWQNRVYAALGRPMPQARVRLGSWIINEI